ncbi:MAG: serpin family protein [Acidimicrobiia bacterium]|nr:serpin family protein [Acidimicrobiia bacterium]MYG73432.1 serpin family protein [Acidimicrobiia bacterium]
MTKLIGLLVVLASIALACDSSETTRTSGPTATLEVPATATVAPEPTVTAVLAPTVARQPADPEAPASEWVAGVNAAGWEFHRHLKGNAVSSPLSIGLAFSLSRAGASVDSATHLDRIFRFPEVGVHRAANTVDLQWAKASLEPTTLEVANRLFPDDGFSPLPAFIDNASAHYGASIQPVDTADAGSAANSINRWVSESTRGLVPTIVSESVVRNQELILVNTVYLKADWLVPFLADLTRVDEFTTADGQPVAVPFMRDYDPVERRFVRLIHSDVVELPYKGGELAMWLLVPHESVGLTAIEESLSAGALTELDEMAQEGLVHLTMPKWEQTLPPTDLFEWLCPQGFCAGAGFDGIAPGIFITAALHGAKVIVDEKGTEAAAATAVAFEESAPPEPDLTVVADRPFLWAITHQETGALLFIGRLVDPSE